MASAVLFTAAYPQVHFMYHSLPSFDNVAPEAYALRSRRMKAGSIVTQLRKSMPSLSLHSALSVRDFISTKRRGY